MTADVETISKTENKLDLEPPGKWMVVFFNDDSTPMDYVIQVLVEIFKHTPESAAEITMTIHNSGRGVAGVFPYEIAEQKASETLADSRNHGYSLAVELEKE